MATTARQKINVYNSIYIIQIIYFLLDNHRAMPVNELIHGKRTVTGMTNRLRYLPSLFQRDYLIRLPLPLAQLYSRANNAKDARGRHDSTYYLFEALVKLGASVATATYLQEVRSGSSRVEAIDRNLTALALPSFGQWVAIFRELARHFGTRADAASHHLGKLWHQLCEPHRDLPGVLALYRRIKHGPDGEPGDDAGCFGAPTHWKLSSPTVMPVFGHGSGAGSGILRTGHGPPLIPGFANDVLAEGILDLIGPSG